MRKLVLLLLLAAAGAAATGAASAEDVDGLLTRAKAAADKYQVEEAVALYTQAIESGGLSAKQLVTAYSGRAEARENYTLAYGLKDEELVLALTDYRKARDLLPSGELHRSEGNVLITLGAYAEAATAHRRSQRFEEPWLHWSLIGLARIERIQGHYDAALKPLDEALRIFREQGGTMPIHYHRGRVLYLKGDFAAAIEAYTAGLLKQPDYYAAYQFRACAQARSGAFTKAVEDIEKSVELRNASPDEAWEKTPYAKADREDQANDVAIIKAMAAGKAGESDGVKLCRQTWNDGERLRERSPLVPPDMSNIARNDHGSTWRLVNAPVAASERCARRHDDACRR